jgi:hypothetical protein
MSESFQGSYMMLHSPERSTMKSGLNAVPKTSRGAWTAIAVRRQLPFPVPTRQSNEITLFLPHSPSMTFQTDVAA